MMMMMVMMMIGGKSNRSQNVPRFNSVVVVIALVNEHIWRTELAMSWRSRKAPESVM